MCPDGKVEGMCTSGLYVPDPREEGSVGREEQVTAALKSPQCCYLEGSAITG